MYARVCFGLSCSLSLKAGHNFMKLGRHMLPSGFFSVNVAVCAALFFFLLQMAHVIPSTSCLVNFIMGYDKPSISSQMYWSHSRDRKEMRGNQRRIIARHLTSDWSQVVIVDSAIPSSIYLLYCLRPWKITICLRGLYSLPNIWHRLSFGLQSVWDKSSTKEKVWACQLWGFLIFLCLMS